MRLIGVGEWQRVEAAERAVFSPGIDVPDATRRGPFASAIARRVVLTLEGDLFPARDAAYIEALTTAAREVGDTEIVRRGPRTLARSGERRPAVGIGYALDAAGRDFQQPFIAGWRAGFRFDDYRGPTDRLFSPAGLWGLVFDPAGWALLGGSNAFMDAFVRAYTGSLDDDLCRHLDWCREYAAERADGDGCGWIAAHIAGLVGWEAAVRLLREHRVPLPRGV